QKEMAGEAEQKKQGVEPEQDGETLKSRPIRSEAAALADLKAGRGHQPAPSDRVRNIAGALLARWRGAPRVVVLETDPGGNEAGAEGWYDPKSGTVTLVAPNIRGGYDTVLQREVT